MLSLEYELSVPKFSRDEIGYATLVRAHNANLQIKITNDGQTSLSKINVRPVLESYIGQEKPQLFKWSEARPIDLPAKSMVSLQYKIYPHFPGLVAVAININDVTGRAIMSKRQSDTAYEETPVRWWFHVIDDISIKTLRALKTLAERGIREAEK